MSKYDFTAGIPTKLKTKIPLLPVKDIEPSKLHPNPKNAQYFRTETSDYFERLTEDVRKRGIIVPLIAQQDGTLLAGHNRWEIAKRLNLKFVPVQYLASELSEEEAREFVVKDNLLRRQFSSSEWLEIYQQLYPNFEQRLAQHGQKAQAPTKKVADDVGRVDNVHSQKNADNTLDAEVLTAEKIARDTGQSKAAVQKQLQRRKKEQEEKGNIRAKKLTSSVQESNDDTPDTKFIRTMEKQLEKAEGTNEATRKAVMKVLKDFMKKLK
jgi:ParB-like chromosome segregation protein Spo0J